MSSRTPNFTNPNFTNPNFTNPKPAPIIAWGKAHKGKTPIYDQGVCDGAELRNTCPRPGAYDFLDWPDRIGQRLFYRGGRIEKIQ